MSSHAPFTVRTHAYGRLPDQVGDLYLPAADPPGPARSGLVGATVCLLHGGFWRLPWGRDHIEPLARDLCGRGFRVWNLEYRRLDADARQGGGGNGGGGWPATFEDVLSGIDHLAVLAASGLALDVRQVTLIGHSAGGHLALWAARQRAAAGSAVRATAAVGLAAVADLRLAVELGAGHGAVEALLGGTPDEVPERYRAASPAESLPLGVPQLLVHGTPDVDVPVEISRRYGAAAARAGDDVTLVELPSAGHMDFVDPTSAAHAVVTGWLTERARSDDAR